ncbi:MAG TPA: EAL domain-containing protein [Candidatus Baltobacteraceae bacterium]|nr:EAL domain-containing protein [Candidatus Baltobacteraceae bacterium]
MIEQTADLLSADYPLDLLVERLCDTLTVAFEAAAAFVALVSEDAQLRRKDGTAIERDSPAYHAFASGQPSLLRKDGTQMYVPIAYRDDVYGIIGVEHPEPRSYDEDDVRLLEAIARYFAIAIRNQRAAALAGVPRRAPMFPYVAIALLAGLLSLAILGYASVRAQSVVSLAVALQKARTTDTARLISDYIEDSGQLASIAADLLGPVRDDRPLVETTLKRMLDSAQDGAIYGVGVWYEPYRFDGRTRYYGPYAHRPAGIFHGAPQLTYEWMAQAYDFPAHTWYKRGKNAAPGTTVFTPPYYDTDYTYVSAVRAFTDSNGRFAGVVTVDSIMPMLQSVVQKNSNPPRNVVYVTRSDGQPFLFADRSSLLAFAAKNGVHPRAVLDVPPALLHKYLATLGAQRSDVAVTLPQTGWVIHDSASRASIQSEAQRLRSEGVGAVLAIWLLAGLLLLATGRANRAMERSRDLEIRQAELQSEIADRIKMEEQLRESAYRDTLTGLPNRTAMLEQIDGAIRRLQVWPDYYFAVLFIDLDRFNVVNDSLGHDAGDMLLALIARRLEAMLQREEFLARLGGDEFIFLLKNAANLSDALEAVSRIQKTLGEPFSIGGQEIFVSASIGIASGDRRYERPEEILRDADLAMYHAKRRGRAQFQLFEPVMHERAIAQLELESDLRRAVARRELFVVYQPIIALADGRVAGLEALVRWQHPKRGLILPGDFIPLAEQTGFVTDVDAYVMELACETAKPWIGEFPGLYLAVNASAADLSRGMLARIVSKALRSSGFPGESLKLEITETAVMENADAGRKLLKTLPAGVRIQIDDFGTGYSSLSYLQALPIDELKIDGSFIAGMLKNAEAAEIIRAIISLAKTLRLNVTAEGVETPAQASSLAELGVDFGQGHYYTPPLSAQDALAFLRANVADLRV